MTYSAAIPILLLCLLLEARLSVCLRFTSSSSVVGVRRFTKCGKVSPSHLAASVTESVSFLRDKLQTPEESIIRAVEKLGPNTSISVGDAAALSGTDLNTARANLMILASLTGGDLEVTDNGEILYSFPNGVRSVLEKRSLGQKVKVTYNSAYPYITSAIRASFGIFLIASLAVIVTTFIAINSDSSDDNNGNKRRGGNGGNMRGLDLTYVDWGFSDYLYSRRVMRNAYTDYTRDTAVNNEEMSLFNSVFSYVFGDDDPNAEFSNQQLIAVATRIRQSEGVVIADELAPYLDPPVYKGPQVVYDGTTRGYKSYVVDENWILPAVIQLGGVPIVTDEGNIVYQFKELGPRQQYALQAPTMLYEKEIPFSVASKPMTVFAGSLGIANLFGVLWIGAQLTNPILAAQKPALFATLSKMLPALSVYAVLYNAIPLVRSLFLKGKNRAIKGRNLRREEWSKQLEMKPQHIMDKITSGREAVAKASVEDENTSGEKKMGYSTKESMEVEGKRRESELLKEFDKKL